MDEQVSGAIIVHMLIDLIPSLLNTLILFASGLEMTT